MSATPMIQQYRAIRRTLPAGTLLLFRLGDFYELFFEDAKVAAEILNVALTKRNDMPMCGVPYHSAEAYVGKLIKAGHRVAICDQMTEPRPGRIVERQITQILSPGTVNDFHLLESRRNNYLGAVNQGKNRFGLALLDVTTGEFRIAEVVEFRALEDELARFGPTELIGPDLPDLADRPSAPKSENIGSLAGLTVYEAYPFQVDFATDLLCEHFRVKSLAGFGCADLTVAVGAAGAILHYLKNQLRRPVDHIRTLGVFLADEFVALDAATQQNLELVSSRSSVKDVSLLAALDRTHTPMGGRLLRQWILKPLRRVEPLRRRQAFIGHLLDRPFELNRLREQLRGVRDIERIVGRLSQGSGNARDLAALRASLEALPTLKELLADLERTTLDGEPESLVASLNAAIFPLPALCVRLRDALVEEPPALLREGGIFRLGFHPVLDELRAASTDGKAWVAQLQQQEIERTGIRSLKVRYNSVFGYFIEVTKANLNAVPPDYTRKQTTVNGERFVTPALKEMEAKILGADERAKTLEYELFGELRSEVLEQIESFQSTAQSLAQLDALGGLAETARLFGYCRPILRTDRCLEIVEGRHPVLDQNLIEEKFVPNDCHLDGEQTRLMLITGPNMAGKSTFIRQVALIVLLAQIGSFVPARSAEIGLVDRIFTRVGAADDLARGQSTFMVEMNETANILNNATGQSLIILDEIGRGTSTFDGLAIAWSVAEHLHDAIAARTLFATHFHEMTELAAVCSGVKNFNVAVREWNDQIIFLRKIRPGPADKSYGIQVARLAGLPQPLLERAKEILANLEASELNAQGRPKLAEARVFKTRARAHVDPKQQLNLFDLQT
jgi:DNA mismatch repair protein MutS